MSDMRGCIKSALYMVTSLVICLVATGTALMLLAVAVALLKYWLTGGAG